MAKKSKNYGNTVRIDVPSGAAPVPVENGMIYVKVYAKGDTPMASDVHAVTHTAAAPPGDPHDIGSPLAQIAGTYDWEGCIAAPLGYFYATACAEFLDANDPMNTDHVQRTSVRLYGEEGDEPRCGRARKAKRPTAAKGQAQKATRKPKQAKPQTGKPKKAKPKK